MHEALFVLPFWCQKAEVLHAKFGEIGRVRFTMFYLCSVLFVHKNKTSENMLKNAETTSSSHDNTYTYVQQIVGN